MNIMSVLDKLKETNMISNSEEGKALFLDNFNKFGISLMLIKEDECFEIIDILAENKIPLQKSNGIYNFRVFAVDILDLKELISNFSEINELNFLRSYPELLASSKDIKIILKNMKLYQENNINYKKENDYDLIKLLEDNNEAEATEENNDINEFLKTILEDKSLISKVEQNVANDEEENSDVALELQKVENKICEDYLYPVGDEWKIIIDNKEVNNFQDIKDTINKIIELNIPVTYNDALIFVLFYKTKLSVSEIEDILKNNLFEGGM